MVPGPRSPRFDENVVERSTKEEATTRALLAAGELLAEPGVFEAPAVEQAVDHRRDPVHPRVMARRESIAVNDRPGGILGQLLVDLPDELFALLLVRLLDCCS